MRIHVCIYNIYIYIYICLWLARLLWQKWFDNVWLRVSVIFHATLSPFRVPEEKGFRGSRWLWSFLRKVVNLSFHELLQSAGGNAHTTWRTKMVHMLRNETTKLCHSRSKIKLCWSQEVLTPFRKKKRHPWTPHAIHLQENNRSTGQNLWPRCRSF